MSSPIDKAEKLHLLMSAIQVAAQNVGWGRPLYETFDNIAIKLGEENYGELRDKFLALCSSLKNDIAVIPMKKESVREQWLKCIIKIQAVFDAKNFGAPTSSVILKHFSPEDLSIIDSISERFQAAELYESTDSQLAESFAALKALIDELCLAKDLDLRISNVMKHYIQQLEIVYSTAKVYGDDEFWKKYKEILATFMQMHEHISGFENEKAITNKFIEATKKLSYQTACGISFSANAVTIAQAVLPLLMKA